VFCLSIELRHESRALNYWNVGLDSDANASRLRTHYAGVAVADYELEMAANGGPHPMKMSTIPTL